MHFLWRVFLRTLIVLLALALALALYLALVPGALQAFLRSLPIPGVVDLPDAGPAPLPPHISAPRGAVPRGYFALRGESSAGAISCGFLLELEDGRRVAISAAHATPILPPGGTASFHSPDGALVAVLGRQIRLGRAFIGDGFSADYVLWSLSGEVDPQRFLMPDPRERVEAGEGVLVYGTVEDGHGSSSVFPGVVMSAAPQAVWIQLDDSFDPRGFSGCPVVSRHTGRFIGMAVAGEDQPPVVMGLHPARSLVEKALTALDQR